MLLASYYHEVMGRLIISPLFCLLLSLIYSFPISSQRPYGFASASADDRKEYIVYMGDKPTGDFSTAAATHTNFLEQVFSSKIATESLLYSYKRSFNGFVVKLTEEEVKQLEGMDGVVSVFPNGVKKLHTTRSWDFIGFPQQVNRTSIESDVIIGVLDTGIWPESDSFKDVGFGPPPTKWKGTCQALSNFTCNNKIIGGRYYRSNGVFSAEDVQSPRDSEGHGTHTASTAAGGLVSMASLSGLGLGTARGGVPSARIAVYKICWSDNCYDADILAAFDDAIADGVDIISLSVGGSTPKHYFADSIAIGAFHAMKNGILTSNSAGNDGPDFASITNYSPWSLSVAASTIDRKFSTKVQLGDNEVYEGVSVNTFGPTGIYPLIYGGDAPNITGGFTANTSRYCSTNSLNPNLVKGKIVLCDVLNAGVGAFSAGAVGTVMADSTSANDTAYLFPLPASHLNAQDGSSIASYMSSTSNPTASILKSTEVKDTSAPLVATFSSRGPNSATLDILKPDLVAPGVDILAAWPPISSVSGVQGDSRSVRYNMLSGTSMACPHATAAAAYVKSFHPNWSPAGIKSALMTTALPMSADKNLYAEFAYGSGQIDPLNAVDPGLIYDAEKIDYVKFLCGQGYTSRDLQLVTGDNSDMCSPNVSTNAWDLNYPSFALSSSTFGSISANFSRTVTNVGPAVSSYDAIVTGAPAALQIRAIPDTLSFISLDQKLSFVLEVRGSIDQSIVSASLEWSDGAHRVRSPIVAFVAVRV